MKKYLLALIIVCGSVVSCVSVGNHSSGRITPKEIYAKVLSEAQREDVVALFVPQSHGAVGDAMVKSMNNTLGEASLPRKIRKTMLKTKEENLSIYVGGESHAKVDWALSTALNNSDANSLQGLEVYTNAPLSATLKQTANHAGAKLIHLKIEH